MSRLLIAGTSSGCGKTTVTCALLSALIARGSTPTSFKCGPDYIDPMFHRTASGIHAYNLDPFFLDGDGLRSHLAKHAGIVSVIEGAMGYYDGIAATNEASAYTVARETATPAVLVVRVRGMGSSLGAVVKGFTQYRPDNHIMGVIFNDASESRYADLKQIAADTGVRVYGYLPRNPEWSLPERHLGLLAAGEIAGLKDTLQSLGRQAEQTLDIDGLIALAETAPTLQTVEKPIERIFPQWGIQTRLAIARDEAFCFLYEENLELLQELGCEPAFFSPLHDKALPKDSQGLYICGGYPELHTKTLTGNTSMRESILQAVKSGLPTIAEGGGFMYLHETLDGLPMCGVIPGTAFETRRLQRFGYMTMTARQDNLLCRAGESIRSREFHYWDSSSPGNGFTARKAGRDRSYPCIHATDTLYAGFPHLYFPANPAFAEHFAERMKQYEAG